MDYFYDTFLKFFYFLEQLLVRIPVHCLEKSSSDIVLNISFCIP